MPAEDTLAPNHHGDYPGFAGPIGFVAAVSMVLGREGEARLAERLSGLGPGDMVVDVGCGPGAAVRYAARAGATAVGVDPAPVMLRVARVLTRSSLPARYLRGGAEALPLPGETASTVWSIATVHHWPDLEAGLREVRRVLRPAGRLVAIERQTRPGAHGLAGHGWTVAQADRFVQLCLDHGFVDVRRDQHRSGRRNTVSVMATAPTF